MMFGKDKTKGMSKSEKEAKLAALNGAKCAAEDMMKDGMSGIKKKVSIMSDSKEGLEKGLDLAKKIVNKGEMGEQGEYDQADEKIEDAQEGYEDQQDESEPMELDDIEAEIKHLMELKAKLENK